MQSVTFFKIFFKFFEIPEKRQTKTLCPPLFWKFNFLQIQKSNTLNDVVFRFFFGILLIVETVISATHLQN